MKKILSLILALSMTFALVACGGGSGSGEADREIPDTAAGALLQEFYNIVDANPEATAYEIAEKISTHESIPFAAMAMPVEPGLQMGFNNYEITGFAEGAAFAPMMNAIAFIGYIFTLEEGADADAFMQGLTDNADPRWNICVEAEETLVRAEGNKVFFVMSPLSFEG